MKKTGFISFILLLLSFFTHQTTIGMIMLSEKAYKEAEIKWMEYLAKINFNISLLSFALFFIAFITFLALATADFIEKTKENDHQIENDESKNG